jgi:UDP-3-O-[3-hydroxymyristoyl] glucosamine N-acyltransferase
MRIKSQMKETEDAVSDIAFLGFTRNHLAIFFDLCCERYGVREFDIYNNIEIDETPNLGLSGELYSCRMIKAGETNSVQADKIFYGVVGPYGKYKVLQDFTERVGIQRENLDNLIATDVSVAPSVQLNHGILMERSVVISSQTVIKFGVSIKRRVTIGHHVVIDEFAEINPGALILGNVRIGKGAYIGAGAVIRDGVEIGDHAVVGMGSLVMDDVPTGVVAYGTPCRVIRENDQPRIP